MSSVIVKVRMDGFGYVARAGRGKAARSASSTSDAGTAARRAAAKFFRLDACNVQTERDIVLEMQSQVGPIYRATLPENGGAS